ncbi:hypothetical protein GOP47_0027617 [Adiantum capillus-veneris]|nr:hypothetical protein GOP47_0027617 [Adiantum capillus-veneris]
MHDDSPQQELELGFHEHCLCFLFCAFLAETGMAEATGEISRHVVDEISAMVYSMIGQPSVEAQLQHHLSLSQSSVRFLNAQLRNLLHKHQELEARYNSAKVEASLSATALKQKIGEFDTLKAAYDQLVKECELFRNDREIFAEAAEDAEERRAEADRRAAQAEQLALEAEERERATLSFVESIIKASNGGQSQAFSSPEIKARLGATIGTECSDMRLSSKNHSSVKSHTVSPDLDSLSRSARKKCGKDSKAHERINEACRTGKFVSLKAGKIETAAKSPPKLLPKDARGTKRVLFDACKAREEIKSVARRKVSKNALIDRTKLSGTINKVGRLQACTLDEKENFPDFDAEVTAKIEEAAGSDNETTRYLADLLVILKRNLVRAEAEGDLLYSKYCELHKLLMDTLETFGIIPDVCEARVRSDDT